MNRANRLFTGKKHAVIKLCFYFHPMSLKIGCLKMPKISELHFDSAEDCRLNINTLVTHNMLVLSPAPVKLASKKINWNKARTPS
jgi:hypothetical protein